MMEIDWLCGRIDTRWVSTESIRGVVRPLGTREIFEWAREKYSKLVFGFK